MIKIEIFISVLLLTTMTFGQSINQDDDAYLTLISKGKNEYINSLKTWRWFIDKKADKKEAIIKTIKNDLEDKYVCFALRDLHFDSEGFDNAESYKTLITKVFKIADVQKLVRKVIVEKKNNQINISISLTNMDSKYEIDLNKTGDWLDPYFFDFINNDVLKNAKVEKRFFDLPVLDQSADLIFISEKDFDEAKRIGIFPKNHEYFIL